jgi:glutathione S-transferase
MSGATIAGQKATLITIPPMIDSEFCRFLLVHHRVDHVEEPHTFVFSFAYTLPSGRTLTAPLVYTDAYAVTGPTGVVGLFEPLSPPELRLLREDAGESAQITADMDRFNGALAHAVAQYAYYVLLPHRDIMIEPLTQGCPPLEVGAVRIFYPVFAGALRLLLKLSPEAAEAALALIRTIMDETAARLAGGGSYLVGNRLSLADLAFVTAAAPVVMPENDGSAAPGYDELPPEMQAVVTEFRTHPAGRFVQRIYREWRRPSYGR